MGSRESHKRRDIGVGKVFRTLLFAIAGSAALASSFVLLDAWKAGDRFVGFIRSMVIPAQSEPTIDPRAVVVRQIRGASELTTAIFAMETVVPASRDRTLGGYTIGKTTLLYIAYGEVRAGVDLSELRPEDVQITGDTISLRLPPPHILDSKIDVTRSKVYDYDRGFLGLGPDAAPELQELAQRETLKRIVDTACNEGVLQEASDRAELAVSQLLATAGYVDSIVDIQPPASTACTLPTAELQTL
ncbi:DUF4230 domain-containing protein [Oculatella sp. LEGE 06141]|uniref:DUF4230 domain-containing protein n=1 Tax=Oculatella sp. LEGE 06141 TaxID=1828648 RepID=UPI00187EF765|nr:DUF4230 domain-containing protein [Oculatella sp. LEGE 06141]MBE9181077.1 DUF4230 domain-containing protein [Oculatella sp. LEGE 06141]